MREIKFRAWDSRAIKPEMKYDQGRVQITVSLAMEGKLDDRIFLMQYTGLKDKNGTEIYEGDIIGTKDIPVCGHIRDIWTWVHFMDCIDKEKPLQLMEDMGKGEVIGNIYENPELLK